MTQDEANLEVLKRLHSADSYSRTLLSLNILAPEVEWWAAGPAELLPWAGTFHGPDGVRQFFERLNELMDYHTFEVREYLAQGSQVAVILYAQGEAKPTGRNFESEIVRVYTFDRDKLVKVRNYYDTAAYVASLEAR
jgi:ketosteroid isomerase-like protein